MGFDVEESFMGFTDCPTCKNAKSLAAMIFDFLENGVKKMFPYMHTERSASQYEGKYPHDINIAVEALEN